ncbi:hypothetical protein [Streptomyces sp. AM 2-1-1]|uniref:hypothetical protein n=1 Tax=Streptomyces sp. AM 2-1-1 TaxID=3028709 RepID=UPI0023B910C5|nr:hypothetical protein [Streptomyces sp. AM 2-1-1]WEH38380.1 hypothetical protein PZB77_02005 [Streptomyces sp. AM 2-1-1]
MRAIRVAPLALSGATALLLASPAAHAAQDGGGTSPFTPTVTPSVVAPGGQVTLGGGGCTSGTTITSGVFDTALIPAGSTTATATVDRDAQRGAIYAVTFKCGSTGTAKNVGLTVTGSAASPSTASVPVPATVTPPATLTVIGTATSVAKPSSPSAPAPAGVQGGLGGSVGSIDARELAAGAALVLMAASGTVFLLRRRGTGRH